MPLFYVSIANTHTGKFEGGFICNALTPALASDRASDELNRVRNKPTRIECLTVEISAGSRPIPAALLGRLISRDDMRAWIGEPVIVHHQDGALIDEEGQVRCAVREGTDD